MLHWRQSFIHDDIGVTLGSPRRTHWLSRGAHSPVGGNQRMRSRLWLKQLPARTISSCSNIINKVLYFVLF